MAPIPCTYPYYCPMNSENQTLCPLGYKALTYAGDREKMKDNCEKCRGGEYGNDPQRLNCSICPEGFYCPPGTIGPHQNECPKGSYCPEGSQNHLQCARGTFGNNTQRVRQADCFDCPENYFSAEPGAQACSPCGGSSESGAGQAQCTCVGANRDYQVSDGQCVCKLNFVYIGEDGKVLSEGDSRVPCQPQVPALSAFLSLSSSSLFCCCCCCYSLVLLLLWLFEIATADSLQARCDTLKLPNHGYFVDTEIS